MYYLIVATVLFAFGPILVRMGLKEGLQPNHLVVLRLMVAFPLFLATVVFSGSLKRANITIKEVPFLILISVICMGGAMLCFFQSILHLGAPVAVLVGAVQPAVTAIMAYFVFSRPITARQLGSIVVSFIGVIFLILPMTGILELGKIVDSSMVGFGYSLLATVLAAGAAVGFEKYVNRKSPLIASFHVTGIMLAFLGMAIGVPAGPFNFNVWLIILLLGSITWFLPFLLLFYGLKEVGVSGAALVQNSGPLLTVIIAGAFFKETLFPSQIIGMILILSSVFIFALERRASKEEDFTIPEA
jgi:drug/metabolite transporter (DMT)-like permease